MNSWLNYNHLLYFKTVVDQGSMTKAAEVLRIGQSSISVQIKALEDVLQTKLFERQKSDLVITETGRVVYEYAQSIFNLGNELLDTLDDKSHTQTKIQIGIQDTVPKNVISKISSFIYSRHKALVSIYNGSLDEMTANVAKHKFDLAVLNTPPALNDGTVLLSKIIFKSPLVLAASSDYLHLKDQAWEKFNDVPFILPMTGNNLRNKVEHFFEQKGISIRLVGEATDTYVQKSMAISGNGVITIAKDAIGTYVEKKELFILKEIPEISEVIWIVAGKRLIKNPIALDLLDHFN